MIGMDTGVRRYDGFNNGGLEFLPPL